MSACRGHCVSGGRAPMLQTLLAVKITCCSHIQNGHTCKTQQMNLIVCTCHVRNQAVAIGQAAFSNDATLYGMTVMRTLSSISVDHEMHEGRILRL